MSSSKNKIWIFSEVFYPDETSTGYILTEIAKGLALDYQVTVITESGDNSYGVKASRTLDIKDLEIVRCKSFKLNKNNLYQRFLKLLGTSYYFVKFFLQKVNNNDKVIIVTNPAIALLFFSFFNMFKKANITLIVHDVFPENLVAVKILKNGFLFKLIKWLFDKAYQSFQNITVLGRDMFDVVSNKIKTNKNIHLVENWAQIQELHPKTSDKYDSFKDNRLSFVFAGNIGRLQALDLLVKVFSDFQSKFTLTLIGNGAVKNDLIKMVAEQKISNVKILEALPREKQIEFINSFDVSIVSLSETMFGLGVPSKTYNILACGKPILFIGPKNSEVDLLVNENNLGWSVQKFVELPVLFEKISKNDVQEFSPEKIRALAESKFTYEIFINKMKNILAND